LAQRSSICTFIISHVFVCSFLGIYRETDEKRRWQSRLDELGMRDTGTKGNDLGRWIVQIAHDFQGRLSGHSAQMYVLLLCFKIIAVLQANSNHRCSIRTFIHRVPFVYQYWTRQRTGNRQLPLSRFVNFIASLFLLLYLFSVVVGNSRFTHTTKSR
jgi:hypothetical protein